MLISFSGRTKQIFFLVIKLEPRLLSWLQPRKNNCVPTELDVSISATVEIFTTDITLLFGSILVGLGPDIDAINGQDDVYLEFVPVLSSRYTLNSCNAINSSEFAIAHHCTAITTHNPLSKEMSCHHFPNWAQFFTNTHIDNQNHLQQINIDFLHKYLFQKYQLSQRRIIEIEKVACHSSVKNCAHLTNVYMYYVNF